MYKGDSLENKGTDLKETTCLCLQTKIRELCLSIEEAVPTFECGKWCHVLATTTGSTQWWLHKASCTRKVTSAKETTTQGTYFGSLIVKFLKSMWNCDFKNQ